MTHFLQRTALIALATGALGACSTTDTEALRPNFPTRAPQTPPPPPAAAPAPAPAPAETPVTVAPAAPVEQRPLGPPPTAAPRANPPPAAPAPPPSPPPPPAPAPTAAPAPIATYRSVTTRTVTGRVIEVEGRAQSYKVR